MTSSWSSTTWISLSAFPIAITVLDHGAVIAEGHPGRHPARRARDRGLSRTVPCRCLRVDGLRVAYGALEVVKGVSFEVERGRDRHHARQQRRRQDDDAAHASLGS